MGVAKRILAKGDLSALVASQVDAKRSESRIGGHTLSNIRQLVMIDFSVDNFVSGLMSQKSYIGSIEQIIGSYPAAYSAADPVNSETTAKEFFFNSIDQTFPVTSTVNPDAVTFECCARIWRVKQCIRRLIM